MLTIRNQQMAAFAAAALKKFEDRVAVHLNKYFPEECAKLGELQLLALVRTGIGKAEAYDITGQRDVCKFISLSLLFGANFDSELNWAADVLGRPVDGSARVRSLYAAAHRELDRD